MNSASTPRFAGAERRSYTVPIVLALVALAAAVAFGIHRYPRTAVQLQAVRVELLPTKTEFKSDSIVVGPPAVQKDLYVVATVRVDNQLPVPVTIDSITCEFTTPQDTVLEDNAAQKDELPLMEQSFPALTPMLGNPLLRETTIEAKRSAEGTVLLHFPISEEKWKSRRSAILTIHFYHQPNATVTLP